MVLIKYFLKINSMFILLNILCCQALINKPSSDLYFKNNNNGNYKTLQKGTYYLNSENPLWILQDQKDEQEFKKPFKEKVKYQQIKPLYYHNRQQQLKNLNKNYRNFKTKRISFANNQQIKLPYNYIPFKRLKESTLTNKRRYQNSKFIQNMPIFDAVPGDETYLQTNSNPIFIYTGNKGKMLMNTMMSNRKYPMQEPIPGQTLYPPTNLIFKPKPLVDNLQQKLNITMIPFYAYEAIDPRFINYNTPTYATINSSYTPLTTSSFKAPKKYKKFKQYSAFYSPQEVLSEPFKDFPSSSYTQPLEYTTNFPLTLQKPYANHRFGNNYETPTTPLPYKKFEVTYNDGEDKFQITYEDDSVNLERPFEEVTTQMPTTLPPVTYESYKFSKNYYAFPLYSLNKLMEKDHKQESGSDTLKLEQNEINSHLHKALKEDNEKLQETSKENTWFILNSRYKGPLKSSITNLHSSKYIQSSPTKLLIPLIYPSQSFWWRTTTTEPPPPIMKQIPLTYFRTYTYQQPMTGKSLPFPLMSSTDYITNYGALGSTPYYNPMMPMMTPNGLPTNNEIPMATRPSKSYAGVNVVRSLNSNTQPMTTTTTTTPKPTTTTTTTTTTTPAPTTTTTTSTTTENPTTFIDTATSAGSLVQTDSLVNIEAAFPAFNRKVFTNHFNINYNRPVYPYPEYSVYKPSSPNNPNVNEEIKGLNNAPSQPNVEFVPCMCPVNMQGGYQPGYPHGYQTGYQPIFQSGIPIAGNPSNSIFLAQGRTNTDIESSLDLPMVSANAESVNSDPLENESNLVQQLQIEKLDEEDNATQSDLS